MNINEKLNALLSDPDFYEKGKEIQDVEGFVQLLSTYGVELSEEEAEAVLTQLGALIAIEKGELSESELEDVTGGIATIAIAGLTVKVTAVAAQVALGASLGIVAGVALLAVGCYYAKKKKWI